MWQDRGNMTGSESIAGDSPEGAEDFTSLAGQLLVAMPGMVDPNFKRTVVLVIEHTPEGAFGLVLNRPTKADLLEHLPGWWSVAAGPRVVFLGGPVGEGTGLGVARGTGARPLESWPAVGEIQIVDLDSEPHVNSELEARIFSGYSGWGPGQLESELEANGWFVVDSHPDDVFASHPENLWQEVLRRAGGRHAFFSTYPENPRLN